MNVRLSILIIPGARAVRDIALYQGYSFTEHPLIESDCTASPYAAGLYESITVPALREAPVDYAEERLLWDSDFQSVSHPEVLTKGPLNPKLP